jgi:hypothetical protein
MQKVKILLSKTHLNNSIKKNSSCSCSIVNPAVLFGLIHSKGLFTIVLGKNKVCLLSIGVPLQFQIGLHTKDLSLLWLLQQFLGAARGCWLYSFSFKPKYS